MKSAFPSMLAASGVFLVSASALAQPYPSKPVRLIIPFSAGGANDVVVRIIANRMPKLLGQQVVIDNRTGAGGLIGTQIAATANADGYTLLATGTPHVIVPNLYKKVTYDPIKDFAPIMQIGSQPYGLTVHPSLGVKSVKELIDMAKSQPGKLLYASSGNGGAQHMFQALFVSMAKVNMVHVPYKGSGPARSDLLGGQIKIGCLGISSIINNHKAGQLRIIGVTSAKRSPELPNIPSIAETLPGYDAQLWSGLFAPRGAPATAIARIHKDVTTLLHDSEVRNALTRVGTHAVPTDPKTFGDFVKVELDKWGKLVREVNLKIN